MVTVVVITDTTAITAVAIMAFTVTMAIMDTTDIAATGTDIAATGTAIAATGTDAGGPTE